MNPMNVSDTTASATMRIQFQRVKRVAEVKALATEAWVTAACCTSRESSPLSSAAAVSCQPMVLSAPRVVPGRDAAASRAGA